MNYDPSEELRTHLAEKIRAAPDFQPRQWKDVGDETGFRILISKIAGIPWPTVPLTSIQVTSGGRVIGKMLLRGGDIAMPRSLELWVGLCDIDYAVEMICRCAEGNGLNSAERAFLLNELPRWSESIVG